MHDTDTMGQCPAQHKLGTNLWFQVLKVEPQQQKLKIIFSFQEFESSLESWDPVSKQKQDYKKKKVVFCSKMF